MLIWDAEIVFFFFHNRRPSNILSLHPFTPIYFRYTQKSILQTVPEAVENERPEVPPRLNSNTRFWWNSSEGDDDFCTINVWIWEMHKISFNLLP